MECRVNDMKPHNGVGVDLKCNSTFKIKKRYVVELNLTFHRTP